MSKIHLFFPHDDYMQDDAMKCEQQILEEGGLKIASAFSPKEAKSFAPHIQPDDLLLISGHGDYYDFTSVLAETKKDGRIEIEAETVVESLASAGLTKHLETVLLLSCYAGGRFYHKAWKNKLLWSDATVRERGKQNTAIWNINVSNIAVQAETVNLVDEDGEFLEKIELPIAGSFGMEFGSHGFYNIKVGGYPGILFYAFRDGKRYVTIQSSGTTSYKRSVEKLDSDEQRRLHYEREHAASRYLFQATLDAIQWYGPQGRRIAPRKWNAIKALEDNDLLPHAIFQSRKEKVSGVLKQKFERDKAYYDAISKVSERHRWRFRL